MTTRHNLCILGGGVNSAAGLAHINAIRMTGRYNITSGCFSRDPVVNTESAEFYGVEESWVFDTRENLAEWVAKYQAADRVVILTPTPLHYRDAETMLKVGVPVLCEKALTITSVNADRLAELYREADVSLSTVFNYVFYPAVQRLAQALWEGHIGAITHVAVEMPQQGYLLGRPQSWRVDDFAIYLDLGVHLHHLLWFLTGQSPVAVLSCDAANLAREHVQVTDYVAAQIAYPTFRASMWFSKASAGYSNGLRVRVFGTNGSAEWHQREPDVLKMDGHASLEVPNPRFKAGHPTGFVEALANMYEAWADEPSVPALSPAAAVEGIRLMEAMAQSAKTRKEVVL